jgi:hypothetical protein
MKRALFFYLLFLLSGVVHSAEWVFTADIDPSIKYDDNVFMGEAEQSSFQHSYKPAVELIYALEQMKSSLQLGYSIDRYTSISELNTENPFIDFSSEYQTERSVLGLGLNYVEDTTRSDAENDTGDFSTQSIVTTKSASPSYSYQLTEVDELSVNGEYSERNYSTTDYSDNETKSLTTAWQHQYTERLSAGVSASISNYKASGVDDSSENDNYNLSLTAAYQWSEKWTLDGQLGARYLKSEQVDNLGNKTSESSAGSSFDISLKRVGETDELVLGISRALSPSSDGSVNEQQGISIKWSKELSETLTAQVSTRYQETTSTSEDNDDKRENISFSPSVKWQLERNFGLDFGYTYRQQKSSTQDTVDSNAVMLTLNYDWDGLRASR